MSPHFSRLLSSLRTLAGRILVPAILSVLTLASGLSAAGTVADRGGSPDARITVETDRPGASISPLLYGIFFEEINRAGDGGIYAEMIQNRSFEDAPFPVAWTLVKSESADGKVALDKTSPLNAKNPTSLRLDITLAGGRVGLASDGFRGAPQNPRNRPEVWLPRFERAAGGIAVEKGEKYYLSFFARSGQSFTGPLTVTLERKDGGILACRTVERLTPEWKKWSVTLLPAETCSEARLVLAAQQPGTVWLDMVSMFPRDTYKGRKNGLRADLMRMIERMHPGFVRFPGGCFVEGDEIGNAFRWKETIGDLAERPGHWNLWGYRSTDGLGYHEYLQMCEDLGSEPLFVINCGMSHGPRGLNSFAVPMEQMGSFVQDALDAVEYANGPVTSKWGARRAKAGHPKPFGLKLIEVGNENGGPAYNDRFAMFHDAIKKQYPEVQLVACDWGGVPDNRPLDIIDPHLYSDPTTMRAQATRFDNYDRRAAKIYFGEYAVTTGAGTGNAQAALAEAAFMTGLERNGDIVKMSSYAPLLSHINWKAWNPNAIVYDQARVYGTPSYHVQALFAANRADRNFPVRVEQPEGEIQAPKGVIGVGTWRTQAEFKDIRVTKDGKTLFESDFSKGMEGWKSPVGQWSVVDGALRQSGRQEGAVATTGDPNWSDYTVTLKARKLSGDEGFLITVTGEDGSKSWWNLGGWENTLHGLEIPGIPLTRVPGRIETGRWYDIRIEVQDRRVRCYLDGKLTQEAVRSIPPALYAVAGIDDSTGETVLKVVNTSRSALNTAVNLGTERRGALRGKALVLAAGGPNDENSFAAPTKIVAQSQTLPRWSGPLTHTFPPYSVTVLRLKSDR
jgi:alpha-L-arabinofuranosidase